MFKWFKKLFMKPPVRHRRIPLSVVDAIRADYASGMTLYDMRRKYRMGHPRIRRICKATHTNKRKRRNGYTFARVRPDEVAAIRQFVGQGNSIAAAARKFRRSETTIKRHAEGVVA